MNINREQFSFLSNQKKSVKRKRGEWFSLSTSANMFIPGVRLQVIVCLKGRAELAQ